MEAARYGGAVTATAGGGTIVLAGGSLSGTCACSVSVPVTGTEDGIYKNITGAVVSNGGGTGNAASATVTKLRVNITAAATGSLNNVTSTITSDQTVSGATASATLTTGSVFQVAYAADLSTGDCYIDLANTGENGASLYGPGFGAAPGANVHVLDPGEALVACRSGLISDELYQFRSDSDHFDTWVRSLAYDVACRARGRWLWRDRSAVYAVYAERLGNWRACRIAAKPSSGTAAAPASALRASAQA